jgi:hypothetical protein
MAKRNNSKGSDETDKVVEVQGDEAALQADVIAAVEGGEMLGAMFGAELTGVRLVTDQGEWPLMHPSMQMNLVILVTNADLGDQGVRWLALK